MLSAMQSYKRKVVAGTSARHHPRKEMYPRSIFKRAAATIMAALSLALIGGIPSGAAAREQMRPEIWSPPPPPLPKDLKCKEEPKIPPSTGPIDFWIEFCRAKIGLPGEKFYSAWGGFGIQTRDATKPAAVFVENATITAHLGSISLVDDCLQDNKKTPGPHWILAPPNEWDVRKEPCVFLIDANWASEGHGGAMPTTDPWEFEFVVTYRRGLFGNIGIGALETLRIKIGPNE
ncbi:hypothetical protein [Micromonospora sp. NPDC051141]|uniref:hypothetical protein n=1 Tax=Micromonospora sp. NPDC051141 TaxID=3364284 RepID=UPI0037B6D3FC